MPPLENLQCVGSFLPQMRWCENFNFASASRHQWQKGMTVSDRQLWPWQTISCWPNTQLPWYNCPPFICCSSPKGGIMSKLLILHWFLSNHIMFMDTKNELFVQGSLNNSPGTFLWWTRFVQARQNFVHGLAHGRFALHMYTGAVHQLFSPA